MGTAADDIETDAYAAFDAGRLGDALRLFERASARAPDEPHLHYMAGLAAKYRRDWTRSLRHNLRAIALADTPGDAERWNAGIAATALGDWAEARRQWAACGIRVPAGDGPIEGDFGVVSIRLNAWSNGETLWARRIEVVRARLLNVPLPESGHRFGDIVLHDGASTGRRTMRDGGEAPVLNALQTLERSPFQTFTAFVACDGTDDVDALEDARAPGLGLVEDWTGSIAHYCLRCSYGAPHGHAHAPRDDGAHAWDPDRNVGIAAQSRATVEAVLQRWRDAAPSRRRVESIHAADAAPSAPDDGHVWWRGPDDD
ncbi:tetratricopeptide repeat protein [Tolypothrix campylonemoides VB511288]|nr:tetratricopeptide repeat protein [Tolypothrix campylonemoides VB511288]